MLRRKRRRDWRWARQLNALNMQIIDQGSSPRLDPLIYGVMRRNEQHALPKQWRIVHAANSSIWLSGSDEQAGRFDSGAWHLVGTSEP